jgi:hypothetical protein
MCTLLDALLADVLEPIPLEGAHTVTPTQGCPLPLQWLGFGGKQEMRLPSEVAATATWHLLIGRVHRNGRIA